MTLPLELAVYAEHSPDMKALQPGWNARVFNKTEVEEGSSIRFNATTGVISLSAGVYHISGSSSITYNDLAEHPDGQGWNTKVRPNGAYCRLRYAKDVDCPNEDAIVIGTIGNANMVPSLIETYLDVPRFTEIVLEHQAGFEGVDGIYLHDNSAKSTWHVFARISIRRILNTSTQYQRSTMARVFDAALQSYLARPQEYQKLYASYLGAQPRFVPTSGDGSWMPGTDPALQRVFRSGVLRFGYVDGAPYVYSAGPPNPGLRGLDWALGNELTEIIRRQYANETAEKGLRAEWVKVDAAGGGDPEVAKFSALHEGLRHGRFDIALSGQANISADHDTAEETRAVDWTAPTALLHTNILYTGKDGYDLSGIVGASRQQFIDVVKSWRKVIIMYVINAGPSTDNVIALAGAINAAGGNAVLEKTEKLQDVHDAIANQTIHFSVGDGVASAWIGNQLGFKGLNLDIAASERPLQTAQPVAAFTLPSG
ncbi:MAG: hypothetical protein JWM95_4426 [Gemmatimonadetes bacterium]|nr:hypothetical protein [Gemmatimonadota bacterium]